MAEFGTLSPPFGRYGSTPKDQPRTNIPWPGRFHSFPHPVHPTGVWFCTSGAFATGAHWSPPICGRNVVSKPKTAVPKGVELSLADLEAPEFVVFAHECSMLRYGDLCEFAFLQNRPGESPRLGVSVVVPADDVATHIWESIEEFLKMVGDAYAKRGVQAQPPGNSAPAYGNAPVVGANILRVARAGMNGLMDWYYLSPHSHHLTRTTGQPPRIDPVVRIQLIGPVLLGVLKEISAGHSAWQKQIGS